MYPLLLYYNRAARDPEPGGSRALADAAHTRLLPAGACMLLLVCLIHSLYTTLLFLSLSVYCSLSVYTVHCSLSLSLYYTT